MKSNGEPVELENEVEAEARPNPRGKRSTKSEHAMLSILGGAVGVGAAAGVFLTVDPKADEWVVAEVKKETDAAKKIDSEIKARNTAGAGALIGGIVLGVVGVYVATGPKKIPILGEALLGAGAGLGVAGAVQLSAADKLQKLRLVMV